MANFLCSQKTRSTISSNISKFKRKCLHADNLRKAAVALVAVDYCNGGNLSGLADVEPQSAALLLTRRSGKLSNHAGQWALPGGSIDNGEDIAEAALRELEEEVGLTLSKDRVIGYLDDFVTRSGYHISPVVIWGGQITGLEASADEVASIHKIPFMEFFRSDSPTFERGVEEGRPILYMPVGSTYIATPTAAILYQFKEVALCGNITRVAHYDQPQFAWR